MMRIADPGEQSCHDWEYGPKHARQTVLETNDTRPLGLDRQCIGVGHRSEDDYHRPAEKPPPELAFRHNVTTTLVVFSVFHRLLAWLELFRARLCCEREIQGKEELNGSISL